MKFELDKILIDDILFHMENQDGIFLLDTQKGQVVEDMDMFDIDEETDTETERFISLPEWDTQDGYRLMEKFAAGLKNPVLRQELAEALNKNKGVFRSFKNVLEQYPETEKMWFKFKEQKMKDEVIAWYNSLREEWGLEKIGSEPEDTSSLVLEDFILRKGKNSDTENAAALHKICIKERQDKTSSDIIEAANPFGFPGELCITAENSGGEFAGFVYAVKEPSCGLRICALEVHPEYRGMGLGKALLAKFIEESNGQVITIDLPAEKEYFSRTLFLEGFKPCVQKFIRS
jgi:ribosomal protein S18 acetylase RimI-like enzyme